MGKTKDYKKIIAQLDNLQEHTRSMERDGEEIWKQDSEALQEAMDIISDYEKVVASLNRMIEQYERPEITRKDCCRGICLPKLRKACAGRA